MRKLTAGIGAAALAAGLLLSASAATALADDDHSVRDDHSHPTCSAEHSVNLLTCFGHTAELGDLHII